MAENKSAVAMNLTDMLLCVPSRRRKSKLIKILELSEAAGKDVFF